MANAVTLVFAGESKDAEAAARKVEAALKGVEDSTTSASSEFDKGSQATTSYLDRIGKLGAGVEGMSTAVENVSGVVQGFADIQNEAYERTQRVKRALVDVEQAQEDYNQALRDGKQAQIDVDQAAVDLQQALLDQETAQKALNEAVAKHGKGSAEARQAMVDLRQAGVDVKQAQEDQRQATRDATQATIDAKTAQLDLADAQREANPPDLQKWADKINMVTPLLTGLVGVTGLVTAAQWAWNAAQAASPLTWIVLAIIVVVAGIVLLVTHLDIVKKAWDATWKFMRSAAAAVGRWFKEWLWEGQIKPAWEAIRNGGIRVWNWMRDLPHKLKSAFMGIANFLFAPFRIAFNNIASAWNNTVGRLRWTIPSWVPVVGGNTIAAPRLPRFHAGVGVVPGVVGSEVLAVLQAGERVSSTASSNDDGGWVSIRGDGLIDALIAMIADRVSVRGGRPAQLGIRFA